MSGDLVDDAGGYEEEGIEAFNRMAGAMQGLQSRLDALDQGLGSKVGRTEQAATKAETAAASARQAAERLEATSRQEARSAASWAVLGALAGILGAGGAGYWLGHASGQESGLADGYRAAMDEKAAASWANTPRASSPSPSTGPGASTWSPAATARDGPPPSRTGGRSATPTPAQGRLLTAGICRESPLPPALASLLPGPAVGAGGGEDAKQHPPLSRFLFDPGRRPRVECAGRFPSRRTSTGTERRGRQGWRSHRDSGARRASLTAPSTVAAPSPRPALAHPGTKVVHQKDEGP